MIEQLKTDLSLSILRNEDGKTKEILVELDRLSKEKEQSEGKIGRLIEKKAEKDTEIETVLQKVKHCEERVANAACIHVEMLTWKRRVSAELVSTSTPSQ